MSDSRHLDPSDVGGVETFLRSSGFLRPDERIVELGRAGEGNMNLTLRVVTSERRFIVKQARPYVEKYPHIEAPDERALVETAFYELAAKRPKLTEAMPRLLGKIPDARVLVLEDLGSAQDLTTLYRPGNRLSRSDLGALCEFLEALHEPCPEAAQGMSIFKNEKMRALNHEHIFALPLQPDNGLDLDALTPGLSEQARTLQTDDAYVTRVAELGSLYLSDGDALLHGDYFPGSWLRTERGAIRIIDPEFCFLGPPEFDLGVMTAHLIFAGRLTAADDVLEAYAPEPDRTLVDAFAGVELMRRLIGVAQLPLERGLDEKTALLERSRNLVLG